MCNLRRWTIGVIGFALACTPPQANSYPIVVRAESDPGAPLANVQLAHAGKVLGKTDASGALQLALPGAPGEHVMLDVGCPEGHRKSAQPLRVVLRPLAEANRKPEYRVTCKPELRSIVISVRAPKGANVPLRYLGKEIARTDEQGAAHAALKVAPQENVIVVLDTNAPEHRMLRPQNPELKITVPDRDEVVLFDQTFTVEKVKGPPRKREPVGPVRIGGSGSRR